MINLEKRLEGAKAAHNQALGKKHAIEDDIKEKAHQIASLETYGRQLDEELQVILKAGSRQIVYAASALSEAATFSIREIMPPSYKGLDIKVSPSETSVKAEFALSKEIDGTIYEGDPFEDNGGGVNDIISSSLKLSALVGFEPTVENALLADEPSKHLSKVYRDGLSLAFRDLSRTTGRQVIMVTHDDTLTLHSDYIINIE